MTRSRRRLALLSATALAFIMAAGVAAGAGPPGCYDERTTSVLQAISGLDPGNAMHFTKKGKPKVGAIEAVSGLDINARERNEAWDVYPDWLAEREAASEVGDQLGEELEAVRVEVAALERELLIERTVCDAQLRLVERELDTSFFDRDAAGLLAYCLRSHRQNE